MPCVVVVGDVAVDVVVEASRTPVAGADVPARIRHVPGGAGANTAAWLAHLGADVTLVARVGADTAGREAERELAAAGVRPVFAVDPDAATAAVVVLLDGDGERTMLSDRGAAARLRPSDLPSLDGAHHLHVAGHVLLDPTSRPAGLAALAAAHAAGVGTSVAAAAAPAVGAELRSWVRGVDLLLCNAAELRALTGSAEPGAAAVLDEVGVVVVTAGPDGASWVTRAGTWHAPAPRVAVVDGTGAGDAFAAGLLMSRLGGADPPAALAAGCAAGAAAVTRVGARPVTPR
jgi:sugar/nucleoside kinase (ribokinase family)